MPRTLPEVVAEIRKDWKKVNYAAAPYLDAMDSLNSVSENYFADSGQSVVLYFLSNASSWKGEVAKRVKLELKAMVKASK
jgi:hypothetical protein